MGTRRTYYITTPIYYPNGQLHIGHAYTTVAGDVLARYRRARGYDVLYLTGTDEHGQKIAKQAAAVGKDPQAFVDSMVVGIEATWKMLNISHDDFIRTTQPRHRRVVQQVFARLKEQGDIYLGVYEGRYCTPCESFFADRSGSEVNCPDCHRAADLIREPSYFFRMTHYEERLRRHFAEHPDFLLPHARRKEMESNFLTPGLVDLSVTRLACSWGVPVQDDPKHVVYVWLDALLNYVSALGYQVGEPEGDSAGRMRYWPADIQLVGKDVARFHTIYWPIFLMALNLPLPRRVFAHGFFEVSGEKMSKSKGNTVRPRPLVQRYGADAVRYYLLREVPFGEDGVFVPERFLTRINTDLANDLGNLYHRVMAMVHLYLEGRAPAEGPVDAALGEQAAATTRAVEEALDEAPQFSIALTEIWNLIRAANRYIDTQQPWKQAEQAHKEVVAEILRTLLAVLHRLTVLVHPFMPTSAATMRSRMGAPAEALWSETETFSGPAPGTLLERGEPLFPRLQLDKELTLLLRDLSQDGEFTGHAETAEGQKEE